MNAAFAYETRAHACAEPGSPVIRAVTYLLSHSRQRIAEDVLHWSKIRDRATGNGVKMQRCFLSECKMVSPPNVTLKLTVHWRQHLKTSYSEFEKGMAHERIPVTAQVAEFLSSRDPELLFMFNSKTHANTKLKINTVRTLCY